MKNRKNLHIAIIAIIVVVVVGGCLFLTIGTGKQDVAQSTYEQTFAEVNLMRLALLETEMGLHINCTQEQRIELENAYFTIFEDSLASNVISEESIKRFNDSVKAVFGSDAKYYFVSEQVETKDPVAWNDGLMYFTLETVLFTSDKVPEEILSDYLEVRENIYYNLSHDYIIELVEYMLQLLEDSDLPIKNQITI